MNPNEKQRPEFRVFAHVSVLRSLRKDPVLRELRRAEKHPEHEHHLARARETMLEQAEGLGLSGDLWQGYFLHLLAEGNNLAGKITEEQGQAGRGIQAALVRDLEQVQPFFNLTAGQVFGDCLYENYQPARVRKAALEDRLGKQLAAATSAAQQAELLLQHYQRYGRGELARYEAFCLDRKGRFQGIPDFPHYAWDDILGYQDQKEQLLANTRQFMAGRGCNNVLSTGSRGTGKSTSIKALIPLFSAQGLRLVQIRRDELHLLARAMERAGKIRSHRFLFFFDDLSFDENEKEYKYLKSAIDGGAAPQPDNVLLCATSNRRHLLKETWAERSDEPEAEVYREDADNESISLSDRFGLILHFGAPTQQEYLAIIDHELQKEGVKLPPEELRILGVRWEMEHSGRNGRIAKQFVQWYLGNH
ncbi:DUF815 domain-containing protein [Acidaminococcus timonensis]|uniref:ATP-binding protein n=1 Tax=Acidaminococcus timonensis TaxID=1871002 RepID=UPI00294213C6|nr:DUF815 domain-containing protein [Acidaminococcus timonensis]